jgi:ubiquinone/menaquinone biosynthesis C-methylase UbiE
MQMSGLPDYKDNAEAYEIEELSRPDEMSMIDRSSEVANKALDGRDNAMLLDLCCGTGLSMRNVAGHDSVTQAVGVDISDEYLTFASQRFHALPHVQLIRGDVVEIDLPEGGWNVVMLASAYHHIEDDRKVMFLKRVRRLLAPDGIAVMAENVLPPYESGNLSSYQAAVSLFYEEVLSTALRGNPSLPDVVRGLIQRVAQYGCDGDYEYKVSMDVLVTHIAEASLRIVDIEKVWPYTGRLCATSGGNYVLTLRA